MAGPMPPVTPQSSSTRVFWLVIVIAAVVLGIYLLNSGSRGGASSPKALSAANRTEAPDLAVRDAKDPSKTVFLRSLKGKVAVLHFWATWCPPCRAEFPEFAKFAAGSAAEGSLVVLPISVDDSADPVGPFLSKIPDRLTSYWDPGTVANALGVSAIPTTIVLDKGGRVAWVGRGVTDWSSKGVPAVVEKLSRE